MGRDDVTAAEALGVLRREAQGHYRHRLGRAATSSLS
jgi:hypothetical protein